MVPAKQDGIGKAVNKLTEDLVLSYRPVGGQVCVAPGPAVPVIGDVGLDFRVTERPVEVTAVPLGLVDVTYMRMRAVDELCMRIAHKNSLA